MVLNNPKNLRYRSDLTLERSFEYMKKSLVTSVMVISLAIVMTGCSGVQTAKNVVPDTQITQVAPDWDKGTCFTYNMKIVIGVGEPITLEMLDLEYSGEKDISTDELKALIDEEISKISFIGKSYDTVGTYTETFDNFKVHFEVVDKTVPVIEGTHDISVVEGSEINLMDGVSVNEGTLSVSDFDSSLLDTAQEITYTAVDEAGNTSEVKINLTITSNPIEVLDKTMYAQSTVNVRAGAGVDFERLGSLSTNDEVHVTGRDKATSWYRIEFNGSEGFVSDSYLGDNTVYIPTYTPSSNDNSYVPSNNGGSNTSESSNSGSGWSGIRTATDDDYAQQDDDLAQRLQDNNMYDEDGNLKSFDISN